jgi:hypothetical protein
MAHSLFFFFFFFLLTLMMQIAFTIYFQIAFITSVNCARLLAGLLFLTLMKQKAPVFMGE